MMSTTKKILVVALAVVALVTVGCKKEKPKLTRKNTSSTTEQNLQANYVPLMDPLINEAGIRVKTLTIKKDVLCYNTSRCARVNGKTLDYFRPYFVFQTYPEAASGSKPLSYRIGPSAKSSSIIGWVRSSDVERWDTRIGGDQKMYGTRTSFVHGFADMNDLVEYIKSPNRSDFAAERAIVRTVFSEENKPMPWPITKVTYPDINGKTYELCECNLLAKFTQGQVLDKSYDPAEVPKPKEVKIVMSSEIERAAGSIKFIDVVFVIDTTISMQPHINAVREVVSKLVNDLSSTLPGNPDVAFRIVEYRDYVDAIKFPGGMVYREHPSDGSFLSARDIQPKIANVKEAPTGSDGWAEAVYDGLHAGLYNSKWRGTLSHRMVILIGDAEAHINDAKNPKNYSAGSLTSYATSNAIQVHALVAGDNDVTIRQFGSIASSTGGKQYTLNGYQGVVQRVIALLQEGSEIGEERENTWQKLHDQMAIAPEELDSENISTQSDVSEQLSDIENYTAIAEFMKFAEMRGVKLHVVGINNPTFVKAWFVTELDGKQLMERKVYLADSELSFLITELNYLVGVLSSDQSSQSVWEDLQKGSVATRAGNYISLFDLDMPGSLDSIYTAVGIPTNGFLRYTRNELLSLPQNRKDEVRARLRRHYIPALVLDQGDSTLFPFYGEDVRWGWVPDSHIP